MPGPRAVITGLGFITCIGNSKHAVMERLLTLQHGLSLVTFMDGVEGATRLVGRAEGFKFQGPHYARWEFPPEYNLPRDVLRSLPPHGVYAACAALQALTDASLSGQQLNGSTALFCASAGSPYLARQHLNDLHSGGTLRGSPFSVLSSISGTLNFNLGAFLRIQGGNCGFVSACSSSSHAIGYAMDEVRLGRHERVIVIGAEEDSAESFLPFAAMRVYTEKMNPQEASCPFDVARSGFVPCGGAVAVIVESESVARARGVTPYASLQGWGHTGDGYSPAMPEPTGAGLERAMVAALRDADVSPGQIGYVNAHATSTPAGDRAEALALRRMFSSSRTPPMVSSTKALTGHGLSLAGAMEVGFCALALRHGFTPGCAHLRTPDEACAGLHLPRETLQVHPGKILKNSSGFGGSNVSIVMGG